MRSLLKLARVTLLYNICFLVTVVLRYYDFIPDRDFKSGVIVSGYILSLIANLILHVWLLVIVTRKKSFAPLQPVWLFIANSLCFIVQIYFLAT
ncbi:MAG: hypothetical protein ABI151_14805 [Chitinophagaceae bacterium]